MARSEQEIMAELQGLLAPQVSGGGQAPMQPSQNPRIEIPTAPFSPESTSNVGTSGMSTSTKTINPEQKLAEGRIQNQIDVEKAQSLIPIQAEEKRKAQENLNDIKKKDFSQELTSFMAVDEAIPRGEGYYRWVEGLKSLGSAVGQEDLRGIAVAAHDAASKKLRVTLARLKDVGNLSQTEQEAAGQMIPGIFDSEKLVTLKRAYLRQLGEGLNSKNSNLVRDTIEQFKKSEAYKKDLKMQEDAQGNVTSVDLNEVFI